MDKSYSVSEVAEKLNISDKTLRRWEEAGRFRSTRSLGNQRRYSIEDIQILDAIKHGSIPDQADLLSQSQAAALCGVAEVTIDRWEREGKIHPFITVGKTYYPRHVLLQKMAELKDREPIAYTPIAPVLEEPRVEAPPPPLIKPRLNPLPVAPSVKSANPSPLAAPSSSVSTANFLLNLGMMLVLLAGYHLLFNYQGAKPVSPQSSGSVQGVSTQVDPSLTLLKTILDPSGALTTTTIAARSGVTTPTIAFNPTSAPSTPTPGTIYYDATSQTLKIWKGTQWSDLAPSQTIAAKDGTLITATGILPKGKNQITIQSENISPSTPITITFTTDYAPAKKYWLEVSQGSFTVHTDFPVSADAPFNYFILSTNLTASPTPAPTPITR